MKEKGWISLHRELLEKPIWFNSTPEQRSVLIAILLMVNHEPGEWEWCGEKFTVTPGQTVTSIDSIRKAAGKGISIQNVRSSLQRFEKLQFLTNRSTKMGRLITITNWGGYQAKDAPTQHRDQQRPNKGPTSNNNDNNENKKIHCRVVDYLNRKTNSAFKSETKVTNQLITARLKEGFNAEDFKLVIDFKCKQWGTDGERQEYLRPLTLFSNKFEGYLNAAKRDVDGLSANSETEEETRKRFGISS